MPAPADSRNVDHQGAAIYRIRVRGAVNPDWSDHLAGLTIKTSQGAEGAEGASQTTLVGRIRDQSELAGVLDSLVMLHLTILSLERVEIEA